MAQQYKKLQYSQLKKGIQIISKIDGELTTTEREAERIARMCQGLYDWQGCREVKYVTTGLAKLATSWLHKNGHNLSVVERQFTTERKDGSFEICSSYYPAFTR